MPWPGGKSSESPNGLNAWINSILPPPSAHTLYCEPFAGMLGVLMSRRSALLEIVNDTDLRVVNWWQVMRDRPGDLERLLRATPISRVVLADAKEVCAARGAHSDRPDVEWAWAFSVIVLQTVGAAGAGWKRNTGQRIGGGRAGLTFLSFLPRLRPVAERFARVQLDCCDAVDLLDRLAQADDALIYVDPPYPGASIDYAEGVDQDALDDVLLSMAGAVAVSGYRGDRPALDDAGWHRYEIESYMAMRAVVGQIGRPRPRRTECLWVNWHPEADNSLF